MSMHVILTGNPGTGKTTIARKLGEILAAIGYLDSGHVVEVDRAKMVSPYQGETPKVVDKLCDKAMGGILFVDEAYTLAPQNAAGERDNQGAQALEKLMKRMEDDRGKFVVIAAGYRTEMENLFRINPGFKSRFTYFLDIKDYSPDQLYQIMLVFAKEKKYIFSPEAEELAKKQITELYNSRGNDFANGRTMRTLFDQICKRQAQRLQGEDISTMSNEELMTIKAADIPYEAPQAVDVSDCLTKLDGLVGIPAQYASDYYKAAYDAACKAIDHFIAEDYTQYRDHWVAYSLNEVTKYDKKATRTKGFTFDNPRSELENTHCKPSGT